MKETEGRGSGGLVVDGGSGSRGGEEEKMEVGVVV